MNLEARFILFHKQSTSGRTRFLRLPQGLLAFDPLPPEAMLRDADAPSPVRLHPAASLRSAEKRLGLDDGSLEAEVEFHAELETANGISPVLLARFTSIDPPFAVAESLGARFISLTEARGLHPIEMDLARRAYETILG